MLGRVCRVVTVFLLAGMTIHQTARAGTSNDTSPDKLSDADSPAAVASGAKAPRTFYDVTRDRPFALEGQFAPLGSPIGVLGLATEISVLPALALYAGFGNGISDPTGSHVQWALGIRPRLAIGQSSALTTSLVFSHGNYQKFFLAGCADDQDCGTWYWRNASWLNADLGYEYRSNEGFLLHVFGGLSQGVYANEPVWVAQGGTFNPAWANGSPH